MAIIFFYIFLEQYCPYAYDFDTIRRHPRPRNIADAATPEPQNAQNALCNFLLCIAAS